MTDGIKVLDLLCAYAGGEQDWNLEHQHVVRKLLIAIMVFI
jgi:hypothetical protein